VIALLNGVFRGRTGDSIILEAGGVGYQVFLPPVVAEALGEPAEGQRVELRIHYQASAQQPKPVLFGFLRESEKEFFELIASLPRMGGKNAAKAMVLPINVLARAIQEENRELLDRLPGVSSSGAEKIIAALRKKVARFVELEDVSAAPAVADRDELKRDAVDLLVLMDVKKPEATRAVDRVLAAHPELETVQDIVTEFFKRQ
jgi:Holliday junction DNA helicase RuvA